MTEQRGRCAVLTPGSVIPESLLRAKVESEKQQRNGIFYALSTLNHLFKRCFERRFDRTCRCLGIYLAKTFCLLPKLFELILHEFGLNSNHVLKISRLAQLPHEFMSGGDVSFGIGFLFFTKFCPARRRGRNGPLR
jgi:hypothetical protein